MKRIDPSEASACRHTQRKSDPPRRRSSAHLPDFGARVSDRPPRRVADVSYSASNDIMIRTFRGDRASREFSYVLRAFGRTTVPVSVMICTVSIRSNCRCHEILRSRETLRAPYSAHAAARSTCRFRMDSRQSCGRAVSRTQAKPEASASSMSRRRR